MGTEWSCGVVTPVELIARVAATLLVGRTPDLQAFILSVAHGALFVSQWTWEIIVQHCSSLSRIGQMYVSQTLIQHDMIIE
jgi:hypothetical protein